MITHPEKLLFPEDGITKGELAAYYERVAAIMVPHVRGRPVTLERYPTGIDQPGFWQKDVSKGAPEWVRRIEVPKKGGTVHYPLLNSARSLLWVANQNTITIHVWPSREGALHQPDLCVFDLDPSTDEPEVVRSAALALHDLLDEIGMPSWIKTSGSKGFHILVPLNRHTGSGDVARFATAVAKLLVKRDPTRLTLEFSKADRQGRIYVDAGRNGHGATFAAPYTVRARPGAPVSAPCTWDEVRHGQVSPRTYTLRNMATRIETVGDLWMGLRRSRGVSLRRALEKVTVRS